MTARASMTNSRAVACAACSTDIGRQRGQWASPMPVTRDRLEVQSRGDDCLVQAREARYGRK